MSVIKRLQKVEEFDPFLDDNKDHLVVLFFSANWSEECKQMLEVFEELSKDKSYSEKLKVLEIEAEENEEITLKYGVDVVPSFVFITNKHIVHQTSGANAIELRKKLNDLMASEIKVSSTEPSIDAKNDLNKRLKNLIDSAQVMIFIKGTPQEPRCGFTKKLLEILESKNVKFGSFDILSDNSVREGLKVYSNWPTYPQLYINGELVGGLDIVKEICENGEFDKMIQEKVYSLEDRLKKLINQSKIMVFMKGTAKEPKCGFSRQAIELLNETHLKYDSFDILSDEEVRQGLKEYSKWPTYPQFYVDGELIGGLDIVKELKQSGDLASTLKGK